MAADKEWLQRSLRHALHALAQPGEVALEMMPVGTVRPDELALNYDNFFMAFTGSCPDELSRSQLQHLVRVN